MSPLLSAALPVWLMMRFPFSVKVASTEMLSEFVEPTSEKVNLKMLPSMNEREFSPWYTRMFCAWVAQATSSKVDVNSFVRFDQRNEDERNGFVVVLSLFTKLG